MNILSYPTLIKFKLYKSLLFKSKNHFHFVLFHTSGLINTYIPYAKRGFHCSFSG